MTQPIQLVALYGAGVASFLAPCVLPLVPASLTVVAGDGDRLRAPGRGSPAPPRLRSRGGHPVPRAAFVALVLLVLTDQLALPGTPLGALT